MIPAPPEDDQASPVDETQGAPMIMRPGQQLLLPANPVFIWASLLVALLLNMAPNMAGLGRAAWLPDFLALVLVFWSVHQPLRVGVGAAFVFGLFMDVHQSALLGQHALAYTALCYFAITIHRRLLWFPVPSQALQVLPLFVAAHAIELSIRLIGWRAVSGLVHPAGAPCWKPRSGPSSASCCCCRSGARPTPTQTGRCKEIWPPRLSLRVLRCPPRGLALLGAARRCGVWPPRLSLRVLRCPPRALALLRAARRCCAGTSRAACTARPRGGPPCLGRPGAAAHGPHACHGPAGHCGHD